jgi:acetaldehyde dehydrogenase (acetylating)
MHHKQVALILATGGTPMVKAAHSTGKPAYGVGPGNVPVYVDRSADIKRAASYIVASKSFDCSTICATEQSVVADAPIAAQLREEMQNLGAYFTSEVETAALRITVFNGDGSMNVNMVGKPAAFVAEKAGFVVPVYTRILVTPLTKVGREEPLSHEKLTTVLGWYEVDDWEAGCETSIALIGTGGTGHTQIIHATNEDIIMAFGLEKPVFRILVNTMGTLGAIGFTTGLMPSLTLGPGGIGGAITGDNISVNHLMNIKRLAYEVTPPPPEMFSAPGVDRSPFGSASSTDRTVQPVSGPALEQIVREVLAEILGK